MAKKSEEFDVSGSGKRTKKSKKEKGSKTKVRKIDAAKLAARIEQRTLRDLAFEGMRDYAMEVNLERSVPDLLDGLKPVHRRIAYQAHVINKRGDSIGQKTARLIGDVTGRLHPHGDSSVHKACETMMHQPTPLVTGDGGWGNLIDNAAAARYNHFTLSNYGWSFFDPDYIGDSEAVRHVTQFVPNFDDTYSEPIFLPALLPNVLLNGTEQGIGVGITTKIPAFTPESLLPLAVRIFKGEKLEVEDFTKSLKFAHKWGGHVVKSKKNKEGMKALMKGPHGSIEFESDLVVNRDKKQITIKDWAPGVDIIKFVEKVRELKPTAHVRNVRGLEYLIEMRKDYNFNQFDVYVEQVQKLTRTREAYKIMVTHRTVQEVDGVYSYDTKLLAPSVPELLLLWCKQRLELEKRSLAYREKKIQAAINYSKLLILVCEKVDEVIAIIRNKKHTREMIVQKLMKLLKVDEESVGQVLNLRLQQLSRLDQNEIEDKLKKQKQEMKQINEWQKKPRKKIAGDISAMLPLIEKDRVVRVKRKDEKLILV